MKADLERCPPWILTKLRSERELRRKLAEQTKDQTRILLAEVKEWRAKAYSYQRQLQEVEAQRKKKAEDLERIKEMAVKTISQLQDELAWKEEELRKKSEVLAVLKQRFLQFQANRNSMATRPIDAQSSGGPNTTQMPSSPNTPAKQSGQTRPLVQTLASSEALRREEEIERELRTPDSVVTPRKETRTLPDIRGQFELELQATEGGSPTNNPSSGAVRKATAAELVEEFSKPERRAEIINTLLLADDLTSVISLCESVDITIQNELAKSVMNYFLHHSKAMTLLRGIIRYEVKETVEIGTLFRASSIASKMMGHYIRLVGRDYLHDVLSPLLKDLALEDKDYEIDTFRSDLSEKQLQKHVEELGQVTTKFLRRMADMIDQCPLQFRHLSNILDTEVRSKFASNWPFAVGNFFFLRYMCPAIIAPDGAMPEFKQYAKGPNVRRTLVLISKTLQNLANGTRFFKEPFMMNMVSWIDDHLEECKQLFLKLAEVPQGKKEVPVAPDETLPQCEAVVLDYMSRHKPNFLKNLEKFAAGASMTFTLEPCSGAQFSEILQALGQPKLGNVCQPKLQPHFKQLVQMLLEDSSFTLATTVTDTAIETAAKGGVDWTQRVANLLVIIAEPNGKAFDIILNQLAHDNITACGPIDNKVSLRMFKCYGRLLARQYLADAIGAHLQKICEQNILLEIEDNDATESTNNQHELVKIARAISEDIIQSLPSCPKPLWNIMIYLQDEDRKHQSPGFNIWQFLFLGLFLPSIYTPQAYGIVREAPKRESQRTLDLLSTTFRHITQPTTTTFGTPQTHARFTVINDFILACARSFDTFMKSTLLSREQHVDKYSSSCGIVWDDTPQGVKDRSLNELHEFLNGHTDPILAHLNAGTEPVVVDFTLPELFDVLIAASDESAARSGAAAGAEQARSASQGGLAQSPSASASASTSASMPASASSGLGSSSSLPKKDKKKEEKEKKKLEKEKKQAQKKLEKEKKKWGRG
jgi:hypothetical protein